MLTRWCCGQVASRIFSRGYRKLPRLEDLPDAHLLPSIALVGRPNVGKSALFNRLVHRKEALVLDTPSDHVTRDYREGLAQLGDLQFRVIDTSGLEPAAAAHSLQGRSAALTRSVLHSSDGVVLLLDARQGVVPGDEELLAWLRRNNPRPLVMVANKADTRAGSNNLEQMSADLAALGYGPPIGISATSGDGLADLYQLLQPLVDAAGQQLQQQWQQSGIHAQQQLLQRSRSAVVAQQPQQSQPQPQPQQQQWPSSGASSMAQAEQAPVSSDNLDHQSDLDAAAAAEEAAVDALVQQHMASSTAASDSDEAAGSYLDAAAAADADIGVSATVATDQVGDDESQHHIQGPEGAQGPLRLAILGLPNVGKSTLMNSLLGFERSLTGPEPGLTRDPTYGWIKHGGLDLQLVDTAGWKRATAMQPTQTPTAALDSKTKGRPAAAARAAAAAGTERASEAADAAADADRRLLGKQLADASLVQARRALNACHVAVLLLDALRLLTIQQAITRLELQLAGLALAQGKALVVALNKADAVPGGPAASEDLREVVVGLLEDRFLEAGRLPVVLLSALEGQGTEQVLDAVVGAYSKWNKKLSSFKLRTTLAKHSVRFFGTGGTASLLSRIKWAVQLKARPPTFVLLLRGASPVHEGGQRFLSNMLRQSLKLQGVPLRLYLRYNKRYREAQHTAGHARAHRSKRLHQQRRQRHKAGRHS